ncbi:MAG: transposase [Desulfobacterales bacterium]
MPRLARLDAPGVMHHVIGRGIEKRNIFFNDTDRNDFLERLSGIAQDGGMDVYAWTLMPNHFHFLCKTSKQPLATSMRKLLTGYVVNFNRRHRRHGHLFQNRYKSIVCQEDRYLKELVRYIHLNLLRAGLVNNLDELDRCPWSGHSTLMGKVEREWQDTEYILSFFGKGRDRREQYQRYLEKGIALGRRPELVGGGLIRSLGGWSEVLALRNRGEKQVSDQRILGDAEFVQEVISGLDEQVKKNLRLSGQRINIDDLAERVCEKYNIHRGEMRSGSRRHDIVIARGVLSWIAVRELGYSGADVARYLGVTTSCVTRVVSATKPPDVEDLIQNL